MWGKGLAPGAAFDTGGPSKALLSVLPKLKAGRCFVPGAGRAYDAHLLAGSGDGRAREVLALDLSATACREANAWLASQPAPAEGSVTVKEGDFFLDPGLGKFDVIWDCTFLCALDPSVRAQWAARQSDLLNPCGQLVTLIFPIAPEKVGGPPYALTVELVESLLKPLGFVSVDQIDLPAGTHMPTMPFGNTVVVWKKKEEQTE